MEEKNICNIRKIEKIPLKKISPLRSYIARLFRGKDGNWYIDKCMKQFDEYVNHVLLEALEDVNEADLLKLRCIKEKKKLEDKETEKAIEKKTLIACDIEQLELKKDQFYEELALLLDEKKAYLNKCLVIYTGDYQISKNDINTKEILDRIKRNELRYEEIDKKEEI